MIYLAWIISAFVAVGVGVFLATRLDKADETTKE